MTHCLSDYDLWKTDPDRIWGPQPEEREEDPFEEWAMDEADRQFDANAERYGGEDVWDFAERALPPPLSSQAPTE